MSKSTQLIATVLEYLNANVPYAVMRNYEHLPNDNNSRDIDIAITKQDLKRHKTAIVGLMVESGWKIVTYLDNGRLTTYVCGIINDGEVEMVQWDFFIHTSHRGITFAESAEMLENRVFNGRVYHLNKDWEFLDKYLYNRAVGAQYPHKYNSVRKEVENSDFVKQKLNSVFDCNDTQQIDKMSGNRLLLCTLKNNLKSNPLRTICRFPRTQLIMWRNFLMSYTAPRIGFTGPDGSGKTTVIELMHKKISPVFGEASEFFHFRPTLIPNLGETAHTARLKKEVDREYDKPHRGGKTGTVSSFARLCYYTLDYIVGFWVKVKPHCAITKFVVFDRYYTDIIADSRRSNIYLNTKLLYYWGRIFIPRLQYNILLTADTDVILARKQELDRKGIEDINSKLDYLVQKRGYFLVKNNGTAEQAASEILQIIFNGQHAKNIRKV